MGPLFRKFVLALTAVSCTTGLSAQSEISDEIFSDNKQPVILELKNIERMQYTVYVDARPATTVEGYKLNPNKAWSRTDERVESRTVILDNLDPGLHTVIIDAKQEPHPRKAQRREEFLFEYEPLIFTINADPSAMTTHTIDVHSGLQSKVVANNAFVFTKGLDKDWQSVVERIAGSKLEVRVRQYREKDKIGRVKRRLDSKGMWDRAKKYINYVDINVFMDGRLVLDVDQVAYSGRVEYRYWDYLEGKWWNNHFLNNTIKDEQRIYQFVRALPLSNTHELRITGYDEEISYSVIRTGSLPQIVSAGDAD
ncbi:MAG: hypothetical protein HOH43_13530 [Candidatus Latescibacteria bacterium]|jgi:hypothetical protein|nr:hypothetical protein [Candidatus Latescibacterota bacterium]